MTRKASLQGQRMKEYRRASSSNVNREAPAPPDSLTDTQCPSVGTNSSTAAPSHHGGSTAPSTERSSAAGGSTPPMSTNPAMAVTQPVLAAVPQPTPPPATALPNPWAGPNPSMPPNPWVALNPAGQQPQQGFRPLQSPLVGHIHQAASTANRPTTHQYLTSMIGMEVRDVVLSFSSTHRPATHYNHQPSLKGPHRSVGGPPLSTKLSKAGHTVCICNALSHCSKIATLHTPDCQICWGPPEISRLYPIDKEWMNVRAQIDACRTAAGMSAVADGEIRMDQERREVFGAPRPQPVPTHYYVDTTSDKVPPTPPVVW